MKHSKLSLVDITDCILHIYKEKIEENGEDCFFFSVNEEEAMLAVFDGCGGSGARRYGNYRNKTGAYISSRAVSGGVQQWFEEAEHSPDIEQNAKSMKAVIEQSLSVCKEFSGENGTSKLRGSVSKSFPTTAVIVNCKLSEKKLIADFFWAGDSRAYIIDENGLAQITTDDLDGLDPFENISGDGVLTNVISASKDFNLHCKRLAFNKPFIVFAATDGCFGYISTPMEFEQLLLESLLRSENPMEFEYLIDKFLSKIAGDDYTLVAQVIGYGDYRVLKKALLPRMKYLNSQYLEPLNNKTASAEMLWNNYKPNYFRFCEENQK